MRSVEGRRRNRSFYVCRSSWGMWTRIFSTFDMIAAHVELHRCCLIVAARARRVCGWTLVLVALVWDRTLHRVQAVSELIERAILTAAKKNNLVQGTVQLRI